MLSLDSDEIGLTAIPKALQMLWTDLLKPFNRVFGCLPGFLKSSRRRSHIDSRMMRRNGCYDFAMQSEVDCVVRQMQRGYELERNF